jgi:glycosyltransferase involved in cell wall biosynthesis
MNEIADQRRPKVFTWHIHGSYLYYLSQGNYDLYIPVNEEKSEGYYGRGKTFPFGKNVIEVPANEVRNLDFDLILFQTDENYLKDQYEILSSEQRLLPKIFLEHDPPWNHPTDVRHPVNEVDVALVHVTNFNKLMWDNHLLESYVIPHGVTPPDCHYTGELEKGVVVINNLPTRGRMLGLDVFLEVKKHIPLDIVGMGAEELGGKEILHPDLAKFTSRYRFFFNPIRYTSLGLAVCEAMMLGMPIIGLATTEMSVAVTNGKAGYVHTSIPYLIRKMKYLLNNPHKARELGVGAKKRAMGNFNIYKFTTAWEDLFKKVIDRYSNNSSKTLTGSLTEENSLLK